MTSGMEWARVVIFCRFTTNGIAGKHQIKHTKKEWRHQRTMAGLSWGHRRTESQGEISCCSGSKKSGAETSGSEVPHATPRIPALLYSVRVNLKPWGGPTRVVPAHEGCQGPFGHFTRPLIRPDMGSDGAI